MLRFGKLTPADSAHDELPRRNLPRWNSTRPRSPLWPGR